MPPSVRTVSTAKPVSRTWDEFEAETENDYDDYDYGYEDDYEIGDMDFAEERF